MNIVRNLLVILILVFPLSLAAQSSEFGVFISQPQIQSTSLADDPAFDIRVEFDGDQGYGISYNRYWTDHVSTEFALQRLSSGVTLTVGGPAIEATFPAGDLDLTALSGVAQWHFGTRSRIVPYVGAGIVHVTGEASGPDDPTDPTSPVTTDDLESKTSFIANAGIDFRVTPNIAITFDARYFSYDAVAEEDPLAEPIALDTYVYSAGVKLRF